MTNECGRKEGERVDLVASSNDLTQRHDLDVGFIPTFVENGVIPTDTATRITDRGIGIGSHVDTVTINSTSGHQ